MIIICETEIDIQQLGITETSLVVQWLRLHAPNAGGQGLILDQGTKSHILQLGSKAVKKKINKKKYIHTHTQLY